MPGKDIENQIPLIEIKLEELIRMCENYKQEGAVPMEIRDKIEVILTQVRRTLDKIISEYFTSNIFPSNTHLVNIKTYFPFCRTQIELNTCFARINALNNLDPKLFSVLDTCQPYQPNYNWLWNIQTYSNLGHNSVIAAEKQSAIEGIQTSGIMIIAPNMHLTNTQIGNIFIEELVTVNGKIVKGSMDSNLRDILNIKYHYYIQGTDIDVVILSRQGLELIKQLIQDLR